ncbi:MAG: IS3 family transposase, partial [Microbacterium sp.]|nr:IS3 family transposase [Microbacterium sp.]
VRRDKGIRTTVPAKDGTRAGDLLDRDFTAAAPNRTWVTDFERHEALLNRVEVKDLHRRAVAAAR